jgi:Leucine rich repeat
MAHTSVCFGVSDDIPDEGRACAAMAVALPDLGYCTRIPWYYDDIWTKSLFLSIWLSIPAYLQNYKKSPSDDWNMMFVPWTYSTTSLPTWCYNTGVTCQSDPLVPNYANILSISIASAQFSGTLPSEMGFLKNLQTLSLRGVSIYGAIPSSIGDLISATHIDLGANSLTGSIPATISGLSKLSFLQLDANQLSSTIPSTISALTRLSILDLQFNYLTMGTLPVIPPSYFSDMTQAEGQINLQENCLAYGSSVTATNCKPTGAPTAMPTKAPTATPTKSASAPPAIALSHNPTRSNTTLERNVFGSKSTGQQAGEI